MARRPRLKRKLIQKSIKPVGPKLQFFYWRRRIDAESWESTLERRNQRTEVVVECGGKWEKLVKDAHRWTRIDAGSEEAMQRIARTVTLMVEEKWENGLTKEFKYIKPFNCTKELELKILDSGLFIIMSDRRTDLEIEKLCGDFRPNYLTIHIM